jgi:hypothetical protein
MEILCGQFHETAHVMRLGELRPLPDKAVNRLGLVLVGTRGQQEKTDHAAHGYPYVKPLHDLLVLPV